MQINSMRLITNNPLPERNFVKLGLNFMTLGKESPLNLKFNLVQYKKNDNKKIIILLNLYSFENLPTPF